MARGARDPHPAAAPYGPGTRAAAGTRAASGPRLSDLALHLLLDRGRGFRQGDALTELASDPAQRDRRPGDAAADVVDAAAGDVQPDVGAEPLPSSRRLTLCSKDTIWSRRAWWSSTGAAGAISPSRFSRSRRRQSGSSSTLGSGQVGRADEPRAAQHRLQARRLAQRGDPLARHRRQVRVEVSSG